jgi:hypothetical protein
VSWGCLPGGAGGGGSPESDDRRGMPYAAVILLAGRVATRETERMIPMRNHPRRRWGVALIAGVLACGAFGAAPTNAQTGPIIIPPIVPIAVGITPGFPSLVGGLPGTSEVHSQGGVTWSTNGRADVEIDIDRHRGQAAAR